MRSLIDQLLPLAKGKIAKQTFIVYLGQGVQVILGFAINLLLIRHLPLDSYGTFSIFVSSFLLLASLSHWGWTDTYVRFSASHKNSQNFSVMEVFFRKKLLGSVVISTFIFLSFAPTLSKNFYGRQDWLPYLFLAAFTGFFTCLVSFEMNRIRLLERFWLYFWGQTLGSFFRLVAIGGALLYGGLNLEIVLGTYFFVPILLLLFLGLMAPPTVRRQQTPSSETISHSKKYNQWMMVSLYTTAIISNVDLHLLAFFRGSEEVARLGAASRLTLPISMFVTAITTTVLPKLSGAQGNKEVFDFYLRKLKLILPLVTLAFGLGGAILVPALSFLAGKKYGGLESLLFLQLFSILITLLTNPLSLVLLAKDSTKALAKMNLAQLILGLGFHSVLSPRMGAEGAAIASILVNIVGLSWVIFLVRREK